MGSSGTALRRVSSCTTQTWPLCASWRYDTAAPVSVIFPATDITRLFPEDTESLNSVAACSHVQCPLCVSSPVGKA